MKTDRTVQMIPPNDNGVRVTLRTIMRLAYAPGMLTKLRAQAILQEHPDDFVDALRAWVVAHTAREPDPHGVEYIRASDWLLQEIQVKGVAPVDCDDVAVLSASLAVAAGYRVRLVALAFAKYLSHVYAEVSPPPPLPPRWHDMDVQRPVEAATPTRELIVYPR